MKYLLDTCTLLWYAQGNLLTSPTARTIVQDSAHEVAVSTISFWELSMKSVVGKLDLDLSPADLNGLVTQQGIAVLPVTVSHVQRFHQLPTGPRDAFDRLIAAIALDGDYKLITPDAAFDALGVARVW